MGAAGYVTTYDVDEIEVRYKAMWFDHDLYKDWPYLKTITLSLDGRGEQKGIRLALDYWDDQNGHEGSGCQFWFEHTERWPKDRPLPEGVGGWDLDEGYGTTAGTYSAAQVRVKAVLHACQFKPETEVWT